MKSEVHDCTAASLFSMPAPSPRLPCAGSCASLAGIREEEDAAPMLGPGLSPLRRASSGSMPPGAASPQRTASGGLTGSGSLKRELGIPQAEAAQSL